MAEWTSEAERYRWIGCGVYTPAEASRLTCVSAVRVRRWIKGSTFIRQCERRTSSLLLRPELGDREDSALVLTFKDLVEVMCVSSFLKAGVKWPLLRRAHEHAAEILGSDHPFATQKFLTDGHRVLIRVGEESLLDVASDQNALVRILASYLNTDSLDFIGAYASRWWPMGKREPIVVDAARSFGQPIVTEGVPTVILYLAYLAETRSDSIEGEPVVGIAERRLREKKVRYVADWYSVSTRSVRAAIEYESRLAA